MTRKANVSIVLMMMLAVTVGACNKKTPPVVRPQPPVTTASTAPTTPPRPPDPITEPMPVPPEPMKDDSLTSKSLDDLNRDSPLKPVFYDLDSSDVNAAGQQILQATAAVLNR